MAPHENENTTEGKYAREPTEAVAVGQEICELDGRWHMRNDVLR